MKPQTHTTQEHGLTVSEYKPDNITFPHPVVLVHGSFGGAFMWDMMAPALADAGMHVFAPSLRGHGMSTKTNLGDVSMQDYVDDIHETVTTLGLENPVVVGHSMAGLIVMSYATQHPTSAVVAIDPSPSKEVQGESVAEETIAAIPDVYNIVDAGMPTDPSEVMAALPDVSQEMLMKLPSMLGSESGKARRDRKRGISVPKENLTSPLLFIGAVLGASVPFGIAIEKTRSMSEYYDAPLVEIDGATHPGIIMGSHTPEVIESMISWLKEVAK